MFPARLSVIDLLPFDWMAPVNELSTPLSVEMHVAPSEEVHVRVICEPTVWLEALPVSVEVTGDDPETATAKLFPPAGMASVPLKAPETVGEKVTAAVHCALAATDAPQVSDASRNPVPTEMLPRGSGLALVFLIVTVCAALVLPGAVFGKLSVEGEMRTGGI
jgi:hypothetical protein